MSMGPSRRREKCWEFVNEKLHGDSGKNNEEYYF